MQSAAQTAPASKKMLWTGRAVSGLTMAFLLFDSAIHMTKIAPVVQAFSELGFPIRLALGLGIFELICIMVYLHPRTSVLGAILLTGYLGGAVAMQLRVGNPLFGETLFPVYVGLLVWGGIFLRDPRLRVLIPVSRTTAHGQEFSDFDPRGQRSVAKL